MSVHGCLGEEAKRHECRLDLVSAMIGTNGPAFRLVLHHSYEAAGEHDGKPCDHGLKSITLSTLVNQGLERSYNFPVRNSSG